MRKLSSNVCVLFFLFTLSGCLDFSFPNATVSAGDPGGTIQPGNPPGGGTQWGNPNSAYLSCNVTSNGSGFAVGQNGAPDRTMQDIAVTANGGVAPYRLVSAQIGGQNASQFTPVNNSSLEFSTATEQTATFSPPPPNSPLTVTVTDSSTPPQTATCVLDSGWTGGNPVVTSITAAAWVEASSSQSGTQITSSPLVYVFFLDGTGAVYANYQTYVAGEAIFTFSYTLQTDNGTDGTLLISCNVGADATASLFHNGTTHFRYTLDAQLHLTAVETNQQFTLSPQGTW